MNKMSKLLIDFDPDYFLCSDEEFYELYNWQGFTLIRIRYLSCKAADETKEIIRKIMYK